MKALHVGIGTAVAAGLVALAFGARAPAAAQKPERTASSVPDNFPYKIENGRRVPKSNRVTKDDGSWREEVNDGGCTTVREKSAAGEYRESRKCG